MFWGDALCRKVTLYQHFWISSATQGWAVRSQDAQGQIRNCSEKKTIFEEKNYLVNALCATKCLIWKSNFNLSCPCPWARCRCCRGRRLPCWGRGRAGSPSPRPRPGEPFATHWTKISTRRVTIRKTIYFIFLTSNISGTYVFNNCQIKLSLIKIPTFL